MLLGSVDLNLLKPLKVLLEERSVTKAAERLQVSQPTVSVALARLRKHFDDPLLVRNGNEFVLTPLGGRLHDSLPLLMGAVDGFFSLDEHFAPSKSHHSFVIAAVDYAVERFGAPLAQLIGEIAPRVRIAFPTVLSGVVRGAPDSLRSIDGIILPHGYLVDQPHIDLAIDEWVCIVDEESSLGDEPSVDDLTSRPWVNTLDAREGLTPARQQLQLLGVDVDVAVVTPNFHVVPSLVRGTDRAALLPAKLAARFQDHGVRVVPSPFGLAPIRDAFWWHQDREFQPEHVWLRSLISRIADDVTI